MQCCGDPFKDGDRVEWTLSSENDLHWLEMPTTTGVVNRIQAVRCRFAAALGAVGGDPEMLYPVPGSGEMTIIHRADGWDTESDGLRFNGYLVDLSAEGV